MASRTPEPSPATLLRWATLMIVLANVGFVFDYSALHESTIAELVVEYGNLIVPAAFVEAICMAILFAFLLFYFAALWPHRHRRRVYDEVVIPLALTSVLASGWIVAFRHKDIGLCVALIIVGVALGYFMFVRVASVSPSQYSAWLRVPFSLHFGAVTLALAVAVYQWLHSRGWLAETAVEPAVVAAALLAIAAVAGSLIALRYSDFVYPAVIASAAFATFAAQRAHNSQIATDALVVCGGMLVVAILAAAAFSQLPRRDLKDTASRRRAEIARWAKDEGWYGLEGNSSIMRM